MPSIEDKGKKEYRSATAGRGNTNQNNKDINDVGITRDLSTRRNSDYNLLLREYNVNRKIAEY